MENCTVSRVSFRFGVEDRVTFRISNRIRLTGNKCGICIFVVRHPRRLPAPEFLGMNVSPKRGYLVRLIPPRG